MKIEVITIGDELLLGFVVDTNAAFLARALAGVGVEIVRRCTVPDDAAAIAGSVGEALDRTGAVITTGGLGPTSDDMTKPAIAALFGRELRIDEEIVALIEQRFRSFGFTGPMPPGNRQQAMIPQGAVVIPNAHGTAPGIWIEDERGRWVAMLPGVPREMRGMLADELLPSAALLGLVIAGVMAVAVPGCGTWLTPDIADCAGLDVFALVTALTAVVTFAFSLWAVPHLVATAEPV